MGIASVLVDRGRVITFEKLMRRNADGSLVPVRVEGETQLEWTYGQWFDCRVNSPAAAETPDSSGGRIRTAQHPSLIYALEDDDGNRVELHADDKVEVDSEVLGTATFQVTGEPNLYRKKVDLICGEAALMRVLNFDVPSGRVAQLGDSAPSIVHLLPGGS